MDVKGRKLNITVPFRSNPTRNKKFQKKISKKLKNAIMATFLDKIGWKRMRNGENKNYRSVPLQPDA